jgi:hypothetical protein
MGTFICKSPDMDATCRLDATTLGGVATTNPTETVAMSGSQKAGLTGKLGVKGSSAMFDLTTQVSD